jgi:hypothetical protein
VTYRITSWCTLLIVWLFTVCWPAPAGAVDLPVDHWAYQYLARMKTKGLLPEWLDGTRPLPRAQIAAAVSRLLAAAEEDDDRISGVERQRLRWLEQEFAEELNIDGERKAPPDRHLFRWQDPADGRLLLIDLAGRIRGQLGEEEGRSVRLFDIRGSLRARGRMSRHLSFGAKVMKGQVSTSFDRVQGTDVGLTGYFDSRGAIGYYDRALAHISLSYPHVEIQLGRQPVEWGPGRRGQLTLSSSPPAYDFVTLRARLGRFAFVHLHGFLLSDVVYTYQTDDGFIRREYAEKYVAAHRLEYQPFWRLTIGLTESIVYGERDLDPAYLNPLLLFWSAQHSSHDRDNETMSADVELIPLKGLRCYGAVLIDEIYLKEMFADDARNKVAVQAGCHLVDPLGWTDTDVQLEYVRVQPCVYSHKYPVNTYRHDGWPLGHWLEENGDDLAMLAEHRLSESLRLTLEFARTRRGEPGQMPWCHSDSGRYSFLQGVVERSTEMILTAEYEPVKDIRILGGYRWHRRENREHVPGDDATRHEALVTVHLEY